MKEQFWKYSLIAMILGLGVILFIEFIPFFSGILGALTIYILLRKQMIYFTDKKKMRRSLMATLLIGEIHFMFPYTSFSGSMAGNQYHTECKPRSQFDNKRSRTLSRPDIATYRIQSPAKRESQIGSIYHSLHRAVSYGKHHQLHHQSLRFGFRSLFYAYRRP